jgi:outer membrane receptor protein involved in Fe transport
MLPFAYSLDLNGAVRVADYSTAAGTQVTWKVGATWEPTDILLFRAARSRDIRAPNIYELNSAGQTTRVNVLFEGASTQVTQITGGNPALQPEKSDTWTVGGVLTAPFVRGLTLSVDYYNIKLNGAVATISAAQLFDRCERGQQYYCDFITFDPQGVPTQVVNPFLNLNVLRREGIDVELAYGAPLDEIVPGARGKLSLSLTGNWTLTHGTDVGDDAIGFDDQVGEIVGGVPRFRGLASLGYELDAFTLNAQVRVIGKSKYNLDYVEGVDINVNEIPAVGYVDLSASYDITDNIELFGVVDNLLDKAPPIAPSTFGYPTQPAFFDMIGRTYRAGIRGRF